MRNKHFSLAFTALLFVACGTSQPQTTQNAVERDLTPYSTSKELETISTANNHLAFDIYNYFQTNDKNHFSSSYSIFNLLGMLSAGAAGETQEQMFSAMHLSAQNTQDIHRQFNALDMQFSRSSGSFEVAIANALWIQKGYHVKQDFLDTITQNHGASTHQLDFKANTTHAQERINNWTDITTDGKIKDLITPNAINQNTKMVLTNAIHLKAKWTNSFAQQNTLYKNFTKTDGEVIQVPTMHQKAVFRHKNIDGTDLLCMHYKDSDYRLLSIMPALGEFEKFENNLNLESFRHILKDPITDEINLEEKEINLYYPKYEFENTVNMVAPLKMHGMQLAFSKNADFSSITNDASLNISQIIQKTFFKVDEEGTEAATTSALALGTTSKADFTLRFNRPFLFVLCHEPTKTILFLGRVMNPLQTK